MDRAFLQDTQLKMVKESGKEKINPCLIQKKKQQDFKKKFKLVLFHKSPIPFRMSFPISTILNIILIMHLNQEYSYYSTVLCSL